MLRIMETLTQNNAKREKNTIKIKKIDLQIIT